MIQKYQNCPLTAGEGGRGNVLVVHYASFFLLQMLSSLLRALYRAYHQFSHEDLEPKDKRSR